MPLMEVKFKKWRALRHSRFPGKSGGSRVRNPIPGSKTISVNLARPYSLIWQYAE
jgi:hypothetical protein